MEKYNVIVIGSGPGGYIAAIRSAQLGFKTAIVERYTTLGGTCLNVGCIPSKALLDSSEQYYNALTKFKAHGINIGDMKLDFTQMIKRKAEVVKQTCDGVAYLMKKNKIAVITGHATFISPKSISVGEQTFEADNFIIATGSKPSTIQGVTIDKQRIITSTEALSLKEVPAKMVIIGGGVIGLEIGSVYARLGTKIQVVEFTDKIIGNMDSGLGKELQKVLQKEGFEFYLSHKVSSATVKDNEITVTATDSQNKTLTFTGDYCLVAVGRKPYTENLGLDKAGIKTDARGFISVNEKLETGVTGIYAIGDVVRGVMLAHKAEEEGVFVAETIAGQKPHIDFNLIPGVIYTWPEVASVGQTEEQLKQKGVSYKTGGFPFKASARARASMDTDGFVKVLSDSKTDEVLGIHIIGPRAADIIGEAAVAMEFRASAEDIGRICHAHPTYSESLKEAALDAYDKKPLNL